MPSARSFRSRSVGQAFRWASLCGEALADVAEALAGAAHVFFSVAQLSRQGVATFGVAAHRALQLLDALTHFAKLLLRIGLAGRGLLFASARAAPRAQIADLSGNILRPLALYNARPSDPPMDRLLDYSINHPFLAGGLLLMTVLVLGLRNPPARRAAVGVAPNEAIRLMNSGAVLVDLRSANQFKDGHIEGARNLPGDQLAADPKALEQARAPRRSCSIATAARPPPRRSGHSRARAQRMCSACAADSPPGSRRTCRSSRAEERHGRGHRLYRKFLRLLRRRCSALLERRGIAYTEVSVEDHPDLREKLLARSGRRTLPQVYVGERYIGGAAELAALDREPATS